MVQKKMDIIHENISERIYKCQQWFRAIFAHNKTECFLLCDKLFWFVLACKEHTQIKYLRIQQYIHHIV